MRLIGFGHKARQGKNTAAIAMLNAAALDCRVRLCAYADALRAEVRGAVNGAGGLEALIQRGYVGPEPCWCDGRDTHYHGSAQPVLLPSWVKPEQGKPRTLLQWWGTDYRRAQDPDYWVKALMRRLETEDMDLALVTDVRFPNEVDAIRAAGGCVVKVTRTTAPDIKVPAHPSEDVLEGFMGWDYQLEAATLPELRTKATALYQKIVGQNNEALFDADTGCLFR